VSIGFPGAAKALALGGTDSNSSNAVGNSDEVWAIGRDGNLYRWYSPNLMYSPNLGSGQGQWVSTPDAGKAVAASPTGSAWVVNSDGSIYELPAWADLDPNLPVA
jgi:hypothetical protein